MVRVFSEKKYINGIEYICECKIDEHEYIHFSYGKLNGISSNMDNVIEEMGKLIIDFLTIRDIMKNINDDYTIEEENIAVVVKNLGPDKLVIDSAIKYIPTNRILINRIKLDKSFFKEAYLILENMWEDD